MSRSGASVGLAGWFGALLLGLAGADAAAEPRLFQASVRLDFAVYAGTPLTLTNPGRFASIQGSDPASFEIDASLLGGSVTRTMTFAGYPGTTFFSFMNEAGGFGAGVGPGAGTFGPLPSVPGFRASFSGSATRFGGTQRLLGQVAAKLAPPLNTPVFAQPFSPLGGSFGETSMGITGGTGGFLHWTLWGFPWTTGPVTAMGTGYFHTPLTLSALGSDQRTPAGAGTIQLVTPALARRRHDLALEEDRLPLIATMRLQFAPEPAATLLLLAGIAGLAALSRFSQRG
jgi:hypothetical protein